MPHRLVFLDETATTTKMTRLRGRAPCGERLLADAPFGHCGTQTFIAGLRCDEVIAPWVINGAMNRAIFDTCVKTQLAPCLAPGDVVILDNLAAHKSQASQALLKAQGNWLLFLPPYSPDLNPPLVTLLRNALPGSDRNGRLKTQGPPAAAQNPHPR